MMWHDRMRRGRAGQAIDLGEPGVMDKATANSVPAGCRGPRQGDQVAKAKPLMRGCSRIWTRAWGHVSPR
jgi:hypothetical protein